MNATPHRERPGHQWTLWAFAVVATVLLAAAIPTHPDVNAQQSKPEPPPAEAARLFEVNCAMCHGNDGRGAERGPDIVSSRQAVGRSLEDLERIIRTGIPAGGMPPTTMSAERDRLRRAPRPCRCRRLATASDIPSGPVAYARRS